MFTSRGIAVETWITASRDCDMLCEVVGDQAQFKLGGTETSLQLVMDSKALAKLVEVAVRTQQQWQDVPAGEFANFTVTTSAAPG